MDSLVLRMFFSENRFPLFRNMRYLPVIMARRLFGTTNAITT
jgi:hypothetical protein